MKGRVMIIAGSDSSGGAGIQADIKTCTALGCYCATAITALTAQNTQGVFGIHEVPESFVMQQIELVLSDIGADVIKTGMLCNAKIIEIVEYTLQSYPKIPLIVDPVMVSTSGATLLEADAVEALISLLIPRVLLVTPNIGEAEILSGIEISDIEDMKKAGHIICEKGAQAVLVKGGHMNGKKLYDVLCQGGKETVFESERIDSNNTHGTGCTLASAIACGLAQGIDLVKTIELARDYVYKAIKTAPSIGLGKGPLNHCVGF